MYGVARGNKFLISHIELYEKQGIDWTTHTATFKSLKTHAAGAQRIW